jgi:hypothetical protein
MANTYRNCKVGEVMLGERSSLRAFEAALPALREGIRDLL